MHSLVKSLLPPRKSGVVGNLEPCGAIQDDDETEERGLWHYLVVQQVSVASDPEPPKASDKLSVSAGEVFAVDRRRFLRKGGQWSKLLRLKSSGKWVVDVSLADAQVNLVEVIREMGPWKYQAISTVAFLKKPLLCDSADGSSANSNVLATVSASSNVLKVAERYSVVGHTDCFLRLSSHWVRDDRGALDKALVLKGSRQLPPKPVEGIVGSWDYIVASLGGVKTSSGRHLKEGEVVQIVARHPSKHAERLVLPDDSFVFDTVLQGAMLLRAMLPVSVEHGSWVYSVIAKSGMTLRRSATTTSSWLRGGRLKHGVEVAISKRVRCGLTVFLELSDGRGWLFIAKNGKQMMARECDSSSKVDDQRIDDRGDANTDVGSESGTDGGGSFDSQPLQIPFPLPSCPPPLISINGEVRWNPPLSGSMCDA